MKKIVCPHCSNDHIVKNGHRGRKQNYKCISCNKQFIIRKRIDPMDILNDRVENNMTYEKLAKKYKVSMGTIRNKLNEIKTTDIKMPKVENTSIILAVDAVFFNKTNGILIGKDHRTNRVVYIKAITSESATEYLQMCQELEQKGIKIDGVISDNSSAAKSVFSGVVRQICQFHMVQSIVHYLSKKPTIKAAKDLLHIAYQLKKSSSEEFKKLLDEWLVKYEDLLSAEKFDAIKGKWEYANKKLRSAFFSLFKNLPLLFTFETHKEIPNTNNSLEGQFGDFKKKLNNHSGMRKHNKFIFSLTYFSKLKPILT